MHTAILFTGITYVGGGFIFGIALFRANVLARWAAALLALGTLATIAAGLVPQYERLFALPTGFALIGLGYSLWREKRPGRSAHPQPCQLAARPRSSKPRTSLKWATLRRFADEPVAEIVQCGEPLFPRLARSPFPVCEQL